MRRALVLLVGLLLLPAVPVAAEAPLTPQQAADAVLEAVKAGDKAALVALAMRSQPDPWVVADELCARGEHDAAARLAEAAPRKAVEKLPAYVASRRDRKPDPAAREALAFLVAALQRGAWQQVLEKTEGHTPTPDSVQGILVAFYRGVALAQVQRHAESATVLLATAEAAAELGYLSAAAAAYQYAGMSAFQGSDFARAASIWEAGLDMLIAIDDRLGAARTQSHLGVATMSLGNYPRALGYHQRALEAFEDLGDEAGVAQTLTNIGNVQSQLGDHAEALRHYEQALEGHRRVGTPLSVAQTIQNIGNVHWSLGSYLEALATYEAALALMRQIGDRHGAAQVLMNIGQVHAGLGDHAEALRYYEQALPELLLTGDRPAAARTRMNSGTSHADLGDYAAAFREFEAAQAAFRDLGDRHGVARMSGNLGNLQLHLGHQAEALRHFEDALAAHRALGDRQSVARSLLSIGGVQRQLGNHAEALRTTQEALAALRAVGDRPGVAQTLENLGGLQADRGNHAAALERHEQALAAFREIGDMQRVASALASVAVAHAALGDLSKADAALARAREVVQEAPSAHVQARVARGQASLRVLQGEPAQAIAFAREGVGVVSQLATGLADVEGARARDVYAGLFEVGALASLRAGQAEDLFWFLEQGRAASLREGLGSRAAVERAVVPPELRTALRAVRAKEGAALAAYRRAARRPGLKARRDARRAWEGARVEVEQVVARIERAAKAAAAVSLQRTDDLEAVRGYLRTGEALVLYGSTGNAGVALVVEPEGARMVALAGSQEIETAAKALLTGERHIEVSAVPKVRALLVEPLKLGANVQRVLVSPTGTLGYVPFALLLPDREIASVPSGTTLGLLLAGRDKRGKGILALGDPDYRTVAPATLALHRGAGWMRLPPLDATRAEVETIGTTTLLGEKASESGLQTAVAVQERWRAVHFACHGLVDAERPMLSALALTADAENDGFLTALEVFRMEMYADLVVMSACETGKGRIYRTEGIVGLTRAFMFAGSPRVICSLWNVDDDATQALMIRFYELWNPKEGQGLGAAEALKQAQAHVRGQAKWKHPYYWAAWVLWGLPD